MDRFWIGLGALFGAAAVGMAAVAAHGAATRMDAQMLQVLRSAVEMQGWHSLALLFTGLWVARGGGHPLHLAAQLAGVAFALGMLLFCGSLYTLAFYGVRAGLAPAGGISLMIGWLLLGASVLRRPR